MNTCTGADAGLQLSDPVVIISIVAATLFAGVIGLAVHHYHTRPSSDTN